MQGEKRGTVVATLIELLVITVANFFKSIRTRVQKTALETSAIATDDDGGGDYGMQTVGNKKLPQPPLVCGGKSG